VQFVVESACVADWLAVLVSSPKRRCCRRTISTAGTRPPSRRLQIMIKTSQCGRCDKSPPSSVCRAAGLSGPAALWPFKAASTAGPVRPVPDKYAFQATYKRTNERTDAQTDSAIAQIPRLTNYALEADPNRFYQFRP